MARPRRAAGLARQVFDANRLLAERGGRSPHLANLGRFGVQRRDGPPAQAELFGVERGGAGGEDRCEQQRN